MRLKMAACRVTVGAACCAAAIVACLATSVRAQDSAEAAARAVASDLGARQFEKVAARFNETMTKALSVERLAATWDQIAGQIGEFKSAGSARAADVQGQHLVVLTCTFDSATAYITVGFDKDSKVSTLLVTAASPPF